MKRNNKIDIYRSWESIPIPKKISTRGLAQYKKTNLWIMKSVNNQFGFLITKTFGKPKSGFKNIAVDWKGQMIDTRSNCRLENCLIFEANAIIDSKLFCSSMSSLLEKYPEDKIYKLDDIERALYKIEEITSKQIDELNEVIGVWGELYLLYQLLINCQTNKAKYEILNSWEGVESRNKVDFNIISKKTRIEVKTTIKDLRTHVIHGLKQVEVSAGWKGYLASFCIYIDETGEGMTCHDLLKKIRNNLELEAIDLLENKSNLRGGVTTNNKYHCKINDEKPMEFFDFNNVPKPIIQEGITKIEWEIVLENKTHLSLKEKNKLLRLMN